MSTPYIPVKVDMRGSLNLPSIIKSSLGINLGDTILVRQVNGVILLIPMKGEAEAAASSDTLHDWVGRELDRPVTSAPVQVSKGAVTESIKIQAMRERFEQRKALLMLEKEVLEQRLAERARIREENSPVTRVKAFATQSTPTNGDDDIAAFRKSQEAAADRAVQEAVDQASRDLSALPQANPE